MKRNLLLIHLESLSMGMYKLNKNLFPTLSEIEKKSILFEKYFSTATSTLMVISDMVYGGLEQYEKCESLDFVPEEYCYSSSLLDDLKQQGYNTGIYTYPTGVDRKSANARHAGGFQNEIFLKNDYREYLKAFSEGMDKEPFALMACNYISNLSINNYTEMGYWRSGADNWKNGYIALDQSVKDLFLLLKERGKLESTEVILYGDHGDDYWTHGFHNGLAHAIEPNNMLTHTPLFIWNSSISCEVKSWKLINTTDLRKLIYNRLMKEANWEAEIDKIRRSFSLARNEYAAQPLRKDSFNKSYSLTDGKYLMMVSNDGLSLFDIEMDSGCHNNFLRFFILKDGILRENEDIFKKNIYHFGYFMNKKQIRMIRQKYYYMRTNLYQKVARLYIAGNRMVEDMLSEMNFDKINYQNN